jgi:hypothetical protein
MSDGVIGFVTMFGLLIMEEFYDSVGFIVLSAI